MRLIKPYTEIITPIFGDMILKAIEVAGRTCYKSEDKITQGSAKEFVSMLIRRGHESVLEHQSISIKFVVDRGVSHELVRHRIASFSQESTRYCNYGKDEHINFIIPNWIHDIEEGEYTFKWDENTKFGSFRLKAMDIPNEVGSSVMGALDWFDAMAYAEKFYKYLIEQDWKPEQARSVLPNSLKTEIVITANLREWRLIFKQRTSKAAHPQMREVMVPLLKSLQSLIPIIFDDIQA